MRISCLHTNAGNISYYEAAAPEGVVLTHFLRPELYLRAGTRDTAEGLAAEVAAQLRKMSEGADAVLTAATVLAPHTAPPAVSADALLVEAIARRGAGRRVEVFHSNPLAADIVTSLYGAIGGTAGVTITALPEAWDALRCGDHDAHASLLRKAIDRSRADLVALAHPAMADVADHDARILSLVHTALRFFVETGARADRRERVS